MPKQLAQWTVRPGFRLKDEERHAVLYATSFTASRDCRVQDVSCRKECDGRANPRGKWCVGEWRVRVRGGAREQLEKRRGRAVEALAAELLGYSVGVDL